MTPGNSISKRFAEDLKELRQRAGMPSYAHLERLSGHKLRRATISDVLNNNRVNIPDWMFVSALVQACHAFVRENGLDPRDLGTVSDWKRHWDLASKGVIDARFPGSKQPRESEMPAEAAGGPPPSQPPRPPSGDPEDGAGARFLAEVRPQVWGHVPARMTDFIGRDDWLARVRETLVSHGGTSAVAVQGFCGTGKTQLAIEYAHRYKAGYDLVWWVPCDTPDAAREALAELEARLEVPEVSRAPGESRFAGLFQFLQHGRKYSRWLLVFDNANEPEDIRDLIPQREGHILITSRNSRWEATGQMLELDVFSRQESIRFLRSRHQGLGEASAHKLAEAAGDLPLILEHAAGSHIPVDRYVARLDTDPLRLLDSQPADYPVSIASEWRVIIGRLRADNLDALDLLRCLAYFGSEPIPRESLFRGRYLAGVSISPVLNDSIRVNLAILALQRAGLLRVQATADTLELHRLTRYVIRHMVARDPYDSVQRWEHDVHLLLAAAESGNPYNPEDWPGYDELRGHARQSKADKCRDEHVRGLVVNLVRSQCAAGDPYGALSWAERALNRWSSGPPQARQSDASLSMRQARAEALFACGRHGEAAAVQFAALEEMAADPARWAQQMVNLERLTAAGCRVQGDFAAAERAGRDCAARHLEVFGQEHPQAFSGVDTLVRGLTLNGNYAEAVRLTEKAHIDCLAFYGGPGYAFVVFARNSLGRCHWLAGQYGAALDIMTSVRQGYADIVERGLLDANHPWLLTHETDDAAVRRDAGFPGTDPESLARDMHDVHRRCWRALGVRHPYTLAAAVTLGSVLRRIGDRVSEATEVIADAERRYESALPGHPYTRACTGLHAAMRWRATARRGPHLAADVIATLEQVTGHLAAATRPGHPLTLAMTATLAVTQAETGHLDQALASARQAMDGFRRHLGPGHPHSLISEANVATIRAWLGQDDAGDASLPARYEAVFGPGHPGLLRLAQAELIDIDFSPLPL